MEIEMLSTSIICSEMASLRNQDEDTKKIIENKYWESILKKYGSLILSKSFKRISFLFEKNEMITSEPNTVIILSNGLKQIFLNKNNNLSETSEEFSSYQRLSLIRLIMDDFNSKYGNMTETEINTLLQDEGLLSKVCPSLIELLKEKIVEKTIMVLDLRGQDSNFYINVLKGEPYVAKLFKLFQHRNIKPKNLDPWNILQNIYNTSFIRMQELRISPPISNYSSQDNIVSNMLGSYLALKLFQLMNSGVRSDRERYNKIQYEFKNLTSSDFNVAIRTKEVTEDSEPSLGVLQQEVQPYYSSGAKFVKLGIEKKSTTKLVNEAYIQVIKNDYPVAIEQVASGLYEILFLLTTIIGENEKILLLDEPELHLHPTMQKRILNLLIESKNNSGNQIILITHSPYLVSEANIDSTWRFTKTDNGTKIHNLGNTILDLKTEEQKKLAIKLSSADIRSLLFSRGVIFVEGPSDKIVVEYVDRHLLAKNRGANIHENEWSVIYIGGKKSLYQFITLSRMLGIPSVAIIDYDSLMHKDSSIIIKQQRLVTSSIISALWRMGYLKKELIEKILSPEIHNNEWYDQSLLKELRSISIEHGIFVFSNDLESVLQSPKTKMGNKPLKALEKILELTNKDKIPSEFHEMCEFLRKFTFGL